ncbi:MAG: MMPL family transporter [Fibrobacter sp.]|nr:MMPL family transporter [Fibrobacter sp.]
MFSLISKIVKRLTRFPIAILVIGIILSILSVFPIKQLRWDIQLHDTLSYNDEENSDYKKIEKDFGGLGSLTVVLHSTDSLLNYNTAKALAGKLQNDSLVHFVDFETETDFYTRNSLLYIDESDLDTIITRIADIKKQSIEENNPFIVELASDANPDSIKPRRDPHEYLQDIQKKYFDIMAQSHSSADGTIRIVDIYPTHSHTELKASRELLSLTRDHLAEINAGSDVQVFYTGKVYDTIRKGNTLLPEAKMAGKLTAILILLLYIINFYRQPQLIVVSSIATGLPILYTLALAGCIYGRINLFTLLLALVLPGQACQVVSHVFKRYFLERARNLSPQLSIESAVLGIGPSTGAFSCIMAALFACMYFVPLPGLQELAVLGSLGSVLNWLVTILVTTSLLRVFQRKKPFAVSEFRFNREFQIQLLPQKLNVVLIAVISVISLVCLIYGSTNLKFFYDFERTEIQEEPTTADSLVAQTGFPKYDPIIIQVPDEASGKELYRNFVKLKERGGIPHIKNMYTLAQFSPHMSESRKAKLDSLQAMLSQNFISRLDSNQLKTFTLIRESLYRRHLDAHDQPKNILSKFSDRNGNNGVFAFLFHNIDPNDGLACRHLNEDIKKLQGIQDGEYKVTGVPVIRATVLDLILKNLDTTIFVGSFLVWFFLLLYYNRFSRAIFTILPSLFAMSWLLILMRILGIELSVYSSLAFPIIIGASVDGSLQLWTAFYNKQEGTALTVMQKKFSSIAVSQMASLIACYGLLISSHPGLRSIGQVLLLGLLCIFAAQFTIFPLIAGSLDHYRIWKKKKESK